jgi:predicted extracellular nuclease
MRNIIAILLLSIPSFCVAQSNTLVISEVYGGGGNVNATYKSDYIQIFNLSPSPVNLEEYSIQVAEAGESKWAIINLSGVLQANHWYLLKGETGCTDGADLTLEDATANFNLNTTGGKIALVKSNKVLNTS